MDTAAQHAPECASESATYEEQPMEQEEIWGETSLTFANWADQVDYEEAQLAEAGERLMLTWEELEAEHSHVPSMRHQFVAYDERDELGEYLSMINAKARRGRPARAMPARGQWMLAKKGKQCGAAAQGAQKEEGRRDGESVARQQGTKRKSRSRSLYTENERGGDEKKTKKAPVRPANNRKGKKNTNKGKPKKEKEVLNEAGRKLFVGGIIFADLEEDKEAQEVRSAAEVALLVEIRREVFVDVVLASFGDIDRIKAEWDGRYCHVVYRSRAIAERAFATLSDHQERRRLCEVEAAALLRTEGLPEAAAPLPNFYVRWPKDDPTRPALRRELAAEHQEDAETASVGEASGAEEASEEREDSGCAEGESTRSAQPTVSSKGTKDCKAMEEEEERLAKVSVNAWTLMRDQLAMHVVSLYSCFVPYVLP